MSLDIKSSFRRRFERENNTILLGTAYWRSEKNLEEKPIEAVNNVNNITELQETLNSLTGFFAIVTHLNGNWILATDCIQGIPLYYHRSNGDFYVSDSEELIRSELSAETQDPVSVVEYRTVTYVTGPYTLLNEFWQVEPGSIVILSEKTAEIQRYFSYEFTEGSRITNSDLDDILDIIISRLIDYASGRPIWVPLSAGYDSRLLVTALVEAGYHNVYTFSYGQEGNYEAMKSESVAMSLNVPWKFVEYTRDKWQQWFESDDRAEVDKAMELTTVPPLREWPAVSELVEDGIMPIDSVLVPGHSADFLAGSHIPNDWVNQGYVSKKMFLDRIISEQYHYNSMTETEKQGVLDRIGEIVDFSGGPGNSAIEAYERWDWQARQARQITAHVWPHELTGVDWWMPYWDREFIDFWLSVPLEQRINRRFYNKYVWSRYKKTAANPILPEGFADNFWGRIKYRIKQSKLGPEATSLYNRLLMNNKDVRSSEDAYEHPIGNTKMMDYGVFAELYNGDRNVRSYRARERLGDVEF